MTKPAESAVAAVETLELGSPWAELAAAAAAGIAADRAAAVAKLFPLELAPVTGDTIAQYAALTSRLGAAGYAAGLASYHARSIEAHPELAAALRSQEALADVEAAATHFATPERHEPHAVAGARAAAVARRQYETMIAAQLVAVEGHPLAPSARALLECDALQARLVAARSRHEEHARAELERAEADRLAAARVVIDRTVERVREAEAAARDALQKAQVSAETYRLARADALGERLTQSGLRDLRIERGDGPEIYGVTELVASLRGCSIERLGYFEAALREVGR
ncbi:MAG: hypothetical protein ABI467_11340 [Kofleriaceae bacterium]